MAFVGCCSAFSSMLMCDPRPTNKPPALREDAAGMSRRNVMKVGAATSFIAAASEVSTPLARSASAAKSTAAAADGMKNMAPMFEFVEKAGVTGIEAVEGSVEAASWTDRAATVLREVMGKI